MLEKSKQSAIILRIIVWLVAYVVYLTIQILYNVSTGGIENVTTETVVGLFDVGIVLMSLLSVIVGFSGIDTTYFGFLGVVRWVITGIIYGLLLHGLVILYEYSALEKTRELFLFLFGFCAFKVSHWLVFKLFPAKRKISG